MPVYEFVCRSCTINEVLGPFQIELGISEYERNFANQGPNCRCGVPLRRKFSFSIKTPMPDHYNTSAGQYVSSEKQLKDAYKRQSEAATIRTGVEHNFVPVDPQDKEKLGVTDAGLRETYDRRKKLGMPIPKVIEPSKMT